MRGDPDAKSLPLRSEGLTVHVQHMSSCTSSGSTPLSLCEWSVKHTQQLRPALSIRITMCIRCGAQEVSVGISQTASHKPWQTAGYWQMFWAVGLFWERQAVEMGWQEPHKVQQGKDQSPAAAKQRLHAPVHAGGEPAEKKHCRRGPGDPGEHQGGTVLVMHPQCKVGEW